MVSINDVLKASKGLHVDDIFAELWGRKLASDYTVYTGTLPAVLTGTKAGYLQRYKVYGNSASGQECGEKTMNLFNVNRLPSNAWTTDNKYYIDGAVGNSKSSIRPETVDVSISDSGDLTVTASSYYGAGYVVAVTPNTTYTISFATDTVVPSNKSIATITYVTADEAFLDYITVYGGTSQMTFTTPSNAYYILIIFRYTANTITYSDIMLNTGSTALPYEPYGYKIPISSANTTTPIYLGEVETTRRIRKLVLTGSEESWIEHGSIPSWYQLTIDDVIIDNLELCTHYKPSPFPPSAIQNGEILVVKSSASNSGRIIIRDTNYTVKADFLAYLAAQYAAGTPVCVWYVLATPTTAVFNEPLRKIGDYADTLSMEQAQTSIPTVEGANVVDVETTLKPSQIYIKYKGRSNS
jgi:hypothetical protein